MQQKLIDVVGTVDQKGRLLSDNSVSVTSSGQVSQDFSVLAEGPNPKEILTNWTESVGKKLENTALPAGIDIQGFWIKNPNPNAVTTPYITIPDSTNAFTITGANLRNRAQDIWEASFKIGQQVCSAQMSMQNIGVQIQLNPYLIQKLSNKKISDVVSITPPDENAEASTQLWFRKMFQSLGKIQITVGAVQEKFGQWGFIPDDDDALKKIIGEWDDIKDYVSSVAKMKGQGVTNYYFYAPELDISVRGSYDACKNFCQNSKVGLVTGDALGCSDWFKDFWTAPVDGTNGYKQMVSPLDGNVIPFNFLVTADSVAGTGFEFQRQIKMKGGHWDLNIYKSV